MKLMKKMGLAVLGALAVAPAAFASGGGGVDYSEMLEAISFTEIRDGVIGAGAALLVVYLAIKGVKLIVGFVRGG